MAHLSWRQLSAPTRGLLTALSVLEVALFTAAQIDISRRRPDQLTRPKIAWRLLAMINIVGPLSYFRWGRR